MTPAEPVSPREVVVGLDVGTTAVKAAVFGVDSAFRFSTSQPCLMSEPHPGWQVQDPSRIVAAVEQALRSVSTAIGGARVLAIGLSTAMHGLVGLDVDGVPVTDLITWADGRSLPQVQRLIGSGQAPDVHRRSGSPVHPMTPLSKLMWLRENEPDLAGSVRYWAGLKDMVVASLTGQVVTETSSASGTGMWDMTTRDWAPDLVALAGVRPEQLPPIRMTTDHLPLSDRVAAATGLPRGTPVVLGAGDGPLGNVGTDALRPGVAGLSIGTSAALRIVVPRPILDPDGRMFCYHLADDLWVLGAAVSNGGAAVKWAADLFTPDLTHTQALELAAAVPAGADGMVMLPYLLRERAPLWDPTLTGAFMGIGARHRREHFVRAAMEGVALQLSAVLSALQAVAPVSAVHATGGVFTSQLWRDVVAAAFGTPLMITADGDGTALGAAALAMVALGRQPGLSEAVRALHPADEVAEVRPDPAQIRVYDAVREHVGTLIRSYDQVAGLFEPQA